MNIDIAHAAAMQAMIVDERKDIAVARHHGPRQPLQGKQCLRPLAHVAQGQFSDHEGMNDDLPAVEKALQLIVRCPQVGSIHTDVSARIT